MDPVIGLISTNYSNVNDFGVLLERRCFGSLPFGGRYRLIDFPLSNMVNSGIRSIGLITPAYYRSLLDHVGSGAEWSLNRKHGGLFFLNGAPYGLSTGSAKFLLQDLLINQEFFQRDSSEYVLFCASNKVFNIDFNNMIDTHIQSGADVTFLYKPIKVQHSGMFLNLKEGSNRVIGSSFTCGSEGGDLFLDCMLVSKSVLMRIMDGYSSFGHLDLAQILIDCQSQLDLRGFVFTGYVGCMDNLNDYITSSRDLFNRDITRELFWGQNRIMTKVQDSPPTKFSPGSNVTNSYIGSGCIIEGTVENSILFRNVHIKKGAVVRNSIILQHGTIGEYAYLDNVVCDKFVSVSSHVTLTGTPDNVFTVDKNHSI